MKVVVIALGAALSVSVAAFVGVVSFMMGSHSAPVSRAAPPSAASPVTVPTSTSAAPAPIPEASTKTVYVTPKTQAPARVTLASLGSKPCAALFNRGVSYDRMWEYWDQFGHPAAMDVDHDGYPCETVYGDVN